MGRYKKNTTLSSKNLKSFFFKEEQKEARKENSRDNAKQYTILCRMLHPLLMPLSKPTSERKQVNPDLLHCGPKKEKRSTFHFGGLTITIIRSGGVIFWLRLIYIPTQQSTHSSDGA